MTAPNRKDPASLGLMIISGIGLLGGFWGYCENHFAKASDLNSEVEERRELKTEVDQLYLRGIPKAEQVTLHYKRSR